MSFDQLNQSRLRLRRGQKWSLYGAEVLPAWVADMDFEVAEPIRAALAERVANHDLGYPLAPQRTDLPALFAARMQARFNWFIDPGQVVILSDVVQGLYLCLETLSAVGDGVVIQTPIYPPFLSAPKNHGQTTVQVAMTAQIDGQRLHNRRPEDRFVETGGGNDIIVRGDNAFLHMLGHAVQIGPDDVTQVAAGGQGVNLGEHLSPIQLVDLKLDARVLLFEQRHA